MAKYEALGRHLAGLPSAQRQVNLGFRTIERMIGDPLPPSASKYEAWWIGGPAPVGAARVWRDQVQERAWRDAGWTVEEVDLLLRVVTFRRLAGY